MTVLGLKPSGLLSLASAKIEISKKTAEPAKLPAGKMPAGKLPPGKLPVGKMPPGSAEKKPAKPGTLADPMDPRYEIPGRKKPVVSSAADIYANCTFPVLLINREMRILFANLACKNLFTAFFDIQGKYFIDVFGKSFGIEDMRNVRETITNGLNGYFWKGEIFIKSRTMVSVQIKVFISPIETHIEEPSEFVVLFDDVTEENKRLTRATFVSLLEASKLKDNDTGSHIIRVNQYSRRMAEELFRSKNKKYNRIDADFIDNIGFLASMHDVGKIGTPDDILNKEGPLSEWEWGVMREHTKNGAFILSTYPNPMAKEIALSHHERWDGTGYPYQLSGEMIPLAARIVTISDVYDALRMERSYKPALDHDVSVGKMLEGRGTHFDPFLLDTFHRISDDYKKIYDDNTDIVF